MSLAVNIYAKPHFFGDPEIEIEAANISLVGLEFIFNAPGVTRPEYSHSSILELLFKVTNAPESVLNDNDRAFVAANKEALAKLWALSVGDVFKVTIGTVEEFLVTAPVGFVTTTQEAAKAFFDLPYTDRLYGVFPAPKGYGSEPMKRREFETAVDNQAELLLAIAEGEEA